MKKYSIKDIAELAGVSVATVSRVINNNGRFSEETRLKVLKVIDDTGYKMNYSAKSLRMNRSFSIGILVPDISNYFFSDIVQKIEEIFFEKGYSTIICNTARSAQKEIAYLQMLESKMVDGLVIISGAEKFDSNEAQLSKKIPYICIDREPAHHEDTIFVGSNHYQGGFEATDALIQSGVKTPLIARHARESTSGKERKKGFVDALKKNNILFDSESNELIIDSNTDSLSTLLKEKFEKSPKIDGIFAINDFIAFEILEELSLLNKKVPDDIQIIGFDDTPTAKYCSPKLSSVQQNTLEISKLAAESLINLIEHRKNSRNITNFVPVELKLRESTIEV